MNGGEPGSARLTWKPSVIGYRADIDGLRAIAVISVVLFHAHTPGFGGGFSGVDVFFVISGFLITGILERGPAGRDFVEFYRRRALRILPALLVMILLVGSVLALFMMPRDFKDFFQSAIAACLSSSNLYFYWKIGYFEPTSELKPLLHTWSLGVEEQYYLIFPFLLRSISGTLRRYRIPVLIGCAAASFAISVYQTHTNPEAAFFLPFSRLWEIFLGSVIALVGPRIARRVHREAFSLLGLVLIVIAAVVFSSTTPFPGLAALLPCVGASLIIISGGDNKVSALLSRPLLNYTGRISYSLYLWHWPLLAIQSYLAVEPPGFPAQLAVIALSFPIAAASYHFIELPFRARTSDSRIRLGAIVCAMALVCSVGLAARVTGGLPQRFGPEVRNLASASFDTNPIRMRCDYHAPTERSPADLCHIGAGSGDPTFAVIGDSFADALVPGIDMAAREYGRHGLMLSGNCYPLVGIRQGDPYCDKFVPSIFQFLQRSPTITDIIVVARWSSLAEGSRFGEKRYAGMFVTDDLSTGASYAENQRVFLRTLTRTLEQFLDRRILIIAYVPEQEYDVPRMLALRKFLHGDPPLGVSRETFEQRQRNVRSILNHASGFQNLKIVDYGNLICDGHQCGVVKGDVPLYSDDNHPSRSAAMMFRSMFESALARPTSLRDVGAQSCPTTAAACIGKVSSD